MTGVVRAAGAKALWLVIFAILMVGVGGLWGEEEEGAGLTPEREKRARAFVERMMPLKVEEMEEYMGLILDEMEEAIGLAEGERSALSEASEKAVNEALEPWPDGFLESMEGWFKMVDLADLEQAMDQEGFGEFVRQTTVSGCRLPDRLETWEEALEAVLDEERLEQWEGIVAEKREERAAEVDAKLDEWEGQLKDSFKSPMTGELDRMVEKLELDQEGEAALREAAEAITERQMKKNTVRMREMMTFLTDPQWKQMKGRARLSLAQGGETREEIEEQWEKAVRATLGNDHAKWERVQKEDKDAREEEMGKYFAPHVDRAREELETSIKTEINEIAHTLLLKGKRREDLDALGKRAVDQALERAEEHWRKQLRDLPEETFKERIVHGNYYYGVNSGSRPQDLAIWDKGLDKLLEGKEMDSLEAARAERKERRERALSRIVVVELDKKLSLTKTQREGLEPLMGEATSVFPRHEGHGYWGINVSELYRAAGRVDEALIKDVVDDVQWERWKEICLKEDASSGGQAKKKADAKVKDEEESELPDLESVVSEHLFQLSEEQREKFMGQMQVRIDDVSRVLSLKPAEVTRLTTAAKGAVDRCVFRTMVNAERWVRNSVEGATPKTIKKVLASQRGTSFGRSGNAPHADVLWTGTLDELLTDEEQEEWEEAIAEREAYLMESILQMTLSEFENRRRTTQEQTDALEPLLRESFEKYYPDISRYVSGSWYLQSYYVMLPFGGVPEKRLKKVLSEDQWKAFEQENLADISNYWSGIESNHERRMKEKKK
ncbi:MAG: hypothetical protein AAF591_17760 [Verrucomicrobiota bacterium]